MSSSVIRWGKNSKGRIKFRCKNCSSFFTLGSNTRSSERKIFQLFYLRVKYTLTINYLSLTSKISRPTLSKRFSIYLNNPPNPKTYLKKLIKEEKGIFSGFLLIDGTWFSRKRCLIVYKDSKRGVLFWRFSKGEYLSEIESDLLFLVKSGYVIKGVTSDGKKAIISAINGLSIPHQRCLVHLQRSVQSKTTKKPQTIAGKDLLLWSRSLNTITSKYEANLLITWYKRLFLEHKNFLNEKTFNLNPETGQKKWWYTHKSLRQAYLSVINAKESLFTYLDLLNMPKDNNGLEGFFSHLKNKINRHRGLKQTPKENFISWMFWFDKFKLKP